MESSDHGEVGTVEDGGAGGAEFGEGREEGGVCVEGVETVEDYGGLVVDESAG